MQQHVDVAAVWRELDCIVQQIHGHPANQILIAAKRNIAGGIGRQDDIFAVGEHARGFAAFVDQVVKVKFGHRERALSGVGAGKGQHVVDDARQPP